jgi:hypothetical protein
MSIFNPLAWVCNPFNPFSQSRSPSPQRRIRASMVRPRIIFPSSYHKYPFQFRKGSAHRRIRCYQENHEALQHASPLETHLSRAKTSQAHPTRKRSFPLTSALSPPCQIPLARSSALATFSSHLWRICASLMLFIFPLALALSSSPSSLSYFVTELLGTDLHRLLTSRPLEKQFIQYFLYQILVSPTFSRRILLFLSLPFSVGSNMCIPPASSTAIL